MFHRFLDITIEKREANIGTTLTDHNVWFYLVRFTCLPGIIDYVGDCAGGSLFNRRKQDSMADDQGLGPTVAGHEEVIAHQPTSMVTDEDPSNGGAVVRGRYISTRT